MCEAFLEVNGVIVLYGTRAEIVKARRQLRYAYTILSRYGHETCRPVEAYLIGEQAYPYSDAKGI